MATGPLRTTRLSRRNFVATGAAGTLGLAFSPRFGWAEDTTGRGAKIASDADGDVFQVSVQLTTPKSGKDKRMPRPLDAVSCSVFIPRGLKVIRGVTFNPFYEPTVKQQHWRAAVTHWGFAHIGTNLFGVKNDELGETVLASLAALGEASGHGELALAPLCVHGMSIGGGLSSRLVEALPGRVIAAAPVCLEVGPRDEASNHVPMITIFGEKDGRQMEKLMAKLPAARTEHAQWAIAPQWNRRHEWHMANNVILPFYDCVIAHRLSQHKKGKPRTVTIDAQGDRVIARRADPQSDPVSLKPYTEREGWLGDTSTWRTPSPEVAAFEKYDGDPTKACWLPGAYAAALWQAFVTHDSPLKIASPHGVGGGKPFTTYAAGKPLEAKVAVGGDFDARHIEIFDGDQRLADVDAGSATIENLKPGIHALIAVATTADGSQVYSPPNAIVVV